MRKEIRVRRKGRREREIGREGREGREEGGIVGEGSMSHIVSRMTIAGIVIGRA